MGRAPILLLPGCGLSYARFGGMLLSLLGGEGGRWRLLGLLYPLTLRFSTIAASVTGSAIRTALWASSLIFSRSKSRATRPSILTRTLLSSSSSSARYLLTIFQFSLPCVTILDTWRRRLCVASCISFKALDRCLSVSSWATDRRYAGMGSSLSARDFDREKIRLDAHNAVLIADPVTDAAIVENLRVRGYNNPNKRQRPPSPPRRDNNIPPNRAYDNPQPGSSNMGARPMDPNPNYNTGRGRGKRRRSRSRSRSRSPNSGRGRFNSRSGPPNRGRGRGGAPRFNQRQPSNNRNNMDPQAMAAIVRQVVQEMNQPTNQNQRGSRDYRY